MVAVGRRQAVTWHLPGSVLTAPSHDSRLDRSHRLELLTPTHVANFICGHSSFYTDSAVAQGDSHSASAMCTYHVHGVAGW